VFLRINLAPIEASFLLPAPDRTDHRPLGPAVRGAAHAFPVPVEKLNKRFAPLLARLGYPLEPCALPEFDFATLVQRDAMKRYVCNLAEQNGLRIVEVAELKQALASVRTEIE